MDDRKLKTDPIFEITTRVLASRGVYRPLSEGKTDRQLAHEMSEYVELHTVEYMRLLYDDEYRDDKTKWTKR